MSSEQPAAEAAEASVSPPKESPGGGAGGGGAAPPAAAHETNALWVGNLPTHAGDADVMAAFQRSRGKAENSQFMYEENEYGMSEEEGSDDSADYKLKRHKRRKCDSLSPTAAKRARANELLKPDDIVEQIDSRSIAVSPLPYNVKMEDVQSFFAQHGKVYNVMLPRHVLDKRLFCGTAVVEFSEEEEANIVLEKKLNFAGADLYVKHKKEFDTEREAKQEAFEKSKQEGYEKSTTNNDGRNEGYPKGFILGFKLRKILPNKEGTSPSENDNQTITREDLQEYFTKFGTVRYVDISKRRDSGHIRFKGSKVEEEACALAALQHEGGLILKGHLVTLESLPVSSHKEILQAFSLKKYQQFPAYRTILEGGPSDLKFGCTVELDGQLFRSAQLHLRKKEAEQDAAKIAYEFLLARRGDNFADVEGLIEKGLLLAKSILYEFSSKKKIEQPFYNFQRKKCPAKMFLFAATVSIDGKEYTGGMEKSKSAAAESAARLATKLILDTNDECMLHVFRSKKKIAAATTSGSEKKVPGSEWRCADTPGPVMVKNSWTALESPAATSSGSGDRLKLPPSTDAGSSSALAP